MVRAVPNSRPQRVRVRTAQNGSSQGRSMDCECNQARRGRENLQSKFIVTESLFLHAPFIVKSLLPRLQAPGVLESLNPHYKEIYS